MASNKQRLDTFLNKQKYAEIAKRDIMGVFVRYKDLRPQHGPFIFNDGSQKDLVNLDGTLPITYKGSCYNIPICIYIQDTHPYNPPIVYVKPTAQMQIKQGTAVDANGKVDMPYLRGWRYPESDLVGLIQMLVIIFSEEPPVFSSGNTQTTSGQTSNPQGDLAIAGTNSPDDYMKETDDPTGMSLLSADKDENKKKKLQTYKYADLAESDVIELFSQFKDLRLSSGSPVSIDGSHKNLTTIDGTIPVSYNGKVYNIPICIYLRETHPFINPIVYVKPTGSMKINMGTYVNANGKVNLPYLRDWNYPQSDLLGLVQILGIVFSEEPPVFSTVVLPGSLGIKMTSAQGAFTGSDDYSPRITSNTQTILACKVCLLNPLEITIRPCGHFSLCDACYQVMQLENPHCPVCRGPIHEVVKAFV